MNAIEARQKLEKASRGIDFIYIAINDAITRYYQSNTTVEISGIHIQNIDSYKTQLEEQGYKVIHNTTYDHDDGPLVKLHSLTISW